jgi:hypothetical protein
MTGNPAKDWWNRYWPVVRKTTLDAWARSAKAREWASSHPNQAIAPAVIVGILFLLRSGQDAAAATLVGAWFVLARNIAQGRADFRRRITESYGKAVSQLASDKMEERLGGIYTLENISKESPADYRTVMETLTAFVRERARRKAPAKEMPWTMASLYESAEPTSPRGRATDIAAVLTVIGRRDKANWTKPLRGNSVI